LNRYEVQLVELSEKPFCIQEASL